MQTFSIVVPLLGNTVSNDNTLASILQNRPDGCQIIVVHGPEYDDPHNLAEEGVELICVRRKPNLIRYLNHALEVSKGEFVGLVRPGVCLSDNWHNSVAEAFAHKSTGSVAPLLVSEKRQTQVVAAGVQKGMGFRRTVLGTGKSIRAFQKKTPQLYGPTTWVGFYRRELLNAIGRIDEQLDPFYLDLEIGLCLSTLGFGCQPCPDCIATIDRPNLVTREAFKPHGTSAQRAFCRHVLHVGTTANRIQSGFVRLLEFLASPFQMWKFKHAMQRSRAMRFRENDEIFSDDLSVTARHFRRGTAPTPQRASGRKTDHNESAEFEEAGRDAKNLASEKRKLAMKQDSRRDGERAA